MYTSFQSTSDKARIWVYQASREINKEEALMIDKNLKIFLQNWTAHGNELFASAKVEQNHFLIIALDEQVSNASGCSIDALVNFIKQLEQNLKIDFFDRTQIALEVDGILELRSLDAVIDSIKKDEIKPQDFTYNNLIRHKGELEDEWKIPVGESWLKKYFDKKNTIA